MGVERVTRSCSMVRWPQEKAEDENPALQRRLEARGQESVPGKRLVHKPGASGNEQTQQRRRENKLAASCA